MKLKKVKTQKELKNLYSARVPLYYYEEEALYNPLYKPEQKKEDKEKRLQMCIEEVCKYQTISEAKSCSPKEYNFIVNSNNYDIISTYFKENRVPNANNSDIDIHIENDIKKFSSMAEYVKYRPKWYRLAIELDMEFLFEGFSDYEH